MSSTHLARPRAVVRATQWWGHKVPPILGLAYLVLLGTGDRPVVGAAEGTALVVLLVVAVTGVAAFGHLVNDVADRDVDAAADKPNASAALRTSLVVTLLVGALVVGVAPFFLLPAERAAWGLLAAQLLLLVGYSVPPVRWKDRGLAGVLADALYAQVVPFLLTVAALAGAGGGQDAAPLAMAFGAWGLCAGGRGILYHQVDDRRADRTAGTRTFVVVHGTAAAQRLATLLTAGEVLALVGVLVVASQRVPWYGVGLLVALAWRGLQLAQLTGLLGVETERPGVRFVGFQVLNHTYERWMPLLP
ncbi:hypothetical protein B7486_58780, partial [cyanobacterium TDX16]